MTEIVYTGPFDEVEVAGVGIVGRGVPVDVEQPLAGRLLQQTDWRPKGHTVTVSPAPEAEPEVEPEPDGVDVIAVQQINVGVMTETGSTWYSWEGTDSVVHVPFEHLDEVLAAAPTTLRADGTLLLERTKDELVDLAESRGLTTSGTKADLVDRITAPPDPVLFAVEDQGDVDGDAEPLAFPEPEPVEQPEPDPIEVTDLDGADLAAEGDDEKLEA